jgi:hypothetical protein
MPCDMSWTEVLPEGPFSGLMWRSVEKPLYRAITARRHTAAGYWCNLLNSMSLSWRSLPDSNRCYSLERAMSWASRRRERRRRQG